MNKNITKNIPKSIQKMCSNNEPTHIQIFKEKWKIEDSTESTVYRVASKIELAVQY